MWQRSSNQNPSSVMARCEMGTNLRIMQSTARRLHLPMEKVIITVHEHGNTSAASVPLALDTGIRSGQIKPGQRLLLEGVGGGFTWGAVLLTL